MSKAVLLAGFWLAASVASMAFAHKHPPKSTALRAEAQTPLAALRPDRHRV